MYILSLIEEFTKKLKKHIEEFRTLSRTPVNQRGAKWVEKYNIFVDLGGKLFDVFCEDLGQRNSLQEAYGIPMLPEDFAFLQSMRSDRKYTCSRNKDYAWHKQDEEKERKQVKRLQRQSSSIRSTVESASFEFDSNHDEETCDVMESSDIDFEPEQQQSETPLRQSHIKKRRSCRFVETPSSAKTSKRITRSCTSVENEPEFTAEEVNTHVRSSLRNVRDDIYMAMAELDGHNFSYKEMQIALKVIANRCFGCKWKLPDSDNNDLADDEEAEDENTIDEDTLPTIRAIRKMLEKIEVTGLNEVAQKLVKSKDEGHTVTHATDSTTRAGVGTYATAGIHLDKDKYLPLPTLNISRETTNNLADCIELTFDILSEASGIDSNDLYAPVNCHMTDSTAHNKRLGVVLADKMGRDEAAGQLFCSTHTTLAFDRDISLIINKIEQSIGMTNIFAGFLVDVSIDQRQETVSLSALSWALNLFGPEMLSKPWNYHSDFLTYLTRLGRKSHLFHMKDARFGRLSRCAAIMCYHWDDFKNFLDSHDYVTNKLACLVRDSLNLEYIKVVVAVVACMGIHLVSPYHAKTISIDTTHSTLKEFLTSLYTSLNNHVITQSFFELDHPELSGVSQDLFDAVKKQYTPDVVAAVKKTAQSFPDDCMKLSQAMLPQMAKTLGRQRGRQYGFGEGANDPEFPVFEQITGDGDIDSTPINNLEQERQCGDIDHRLKKKASLNASSRGAVLKGTLKLIDDSDRNFRRMSNKTVQNIRVLKAQWSERQLTLKQAGLTSKEAQRLHVEVRKLNILEQLRNEGGPFTSTEEVDEYLQNADIAVDTKAKRMRKEVTYARDSCVSLPKTHKMFKIFDTSFKPRRLLTPQQFGENLKILLGKRAGRTYVTIQEFRDAISNINNQAP